MYIGTVPTQVYLCMYVCTLSILANPPSTPAGFESREKRLEVVGVGVGLGLEVGVSASECEWE